MFFNKKGKLKKKYDDALMKELISCNEQRNLQKKIFESAYSPSKEMENSLKLIESKYFWLLKEAKQRNLSKR